MDTLAVILLLTAVLAEIRGTSSFLCKKKKITKKNIFFYLKKSLSKMKMKKKIKIIKYPLEK